MSILLEKMQDNRFLRIIKNLLKSGYLAHWVYHATLSGVPQGGMVSSILSNVYLDRMDKYVEQVMLPRHNEAKVRSAIGHTHANMWAEGCASDGGRRSGGHRGAMTP
jgi:retron-type reverse transcriptase